MGEVVGLQVVTVGMMPQTGQSVNHGHSSDTMLHMLKASVKRVQGPEVLQAVNLHCMCV